MTSTAILHQTLQVPLRYPVRHQAASLNQGIRGRIAGARICIQRSAAKSIIPSTPITPAIQATRTQGLQSDESHGQRLPWLGLSTSDGLTLSCRFQRLASRLTTRSTRLTTDVPRHWSITSSTMPRGLLGWWWWWWWWLLFLSSGTSQRV
jgi:hypothetical protein